MNIAFLQYDKHDRIGIGILSALLKEAGHITDVFTAFDEDLINDIKTFNPEILALSSSTAEHNFLYGVAEKIKKWKESLKVIIGGPHPTFFPEEIYKREVLDIVCIGEGEKSIVELANRLENNEEYYDIKNFWVKKGDIVIKNELRPLIENLDELPFPDRDIYFNKYPELRNNATKAFILGRGCPFDCTYCFNHQLRELYRGKGKFIRMPSVDYAINQIKEVQEKFGFKWVQITDDTFNYKRKWVEEFLIRFKQEINVRFIVNIRVDLMDEDLALKFVKAGCDRVSFGVEHGNEEFRRKVLNRNYSNEHFIRIAKFFRDHNVRLTTSNMIGFPGETLELAFETIELNRKIKPEMSFCHVLVPYPKTDIYNYCLEHNLIKDNVTIDNLPSPSMFWYTAKKDTHTIVKLKNENELVNLSKFFDLLVKIESLEPIVRALIKLPPNKFYDFVSIIARMSQSVRYSTNREDKLRQIQAYTKTFNLNINNEDLWIEFFNRKILGTNDIISIFMLLLYYFFDKN